MPRPKRLPSHAAAAALALAAMMPGAAFADPAATASAAPTPSAPAAPPPGTPTSPSTPTPPSTPALSGTLTPSGTPPAPPSAAPSPPGTPPAPPAPSAPGQGRKAAPDPGEPRAQGRTLLDGAPSGRHEITLITGDKVTLTDLGGRHAVDIRPGRRPDGTRPTFVSRADPRGLYVYPADALPAVDSGLVDRELFNVRYLAANGYSDKRARRIPVLVQYPEGQRAARATAEKLPASTATADLPSIRGAGLGVDKAGAGAFWAAVRPAEVAPGPAARALGQGVSRLWLDRKVRANLAESVPLIGAPQAWSAGLDGKGVKVAVLDTGADLKHPDLAGKVAEARSFVAGEEVRDGHGHGTHVAATIAGTGGSSGGGHKGVAPGATLLVGKVLADNGSGSESEVIAGMQWAASSGAKVVSMSIGASPTDGGDPMSQAVNTLSASTGALFVIAAGNDGPDRHRINSPGTADAALTVAATTKADEMAGFSSRGPRLDSGLKPDIAAPGVGIVAARAAGTSMGTPVDDHLTSASGTSMATPHVAGVAAILAQKYPDWKAPQYKAALMSTAKDAGHSLQDQGAGRVDTVAVTTRTVFATTPVVDFGTGDEGSRTRELTYANLGDRPVTLTLTPALRRTGSEPAEGALSADRTLTVPARGTATARVTLNPEGLARTWYSGSVVAEAGGARLVTPVGLNNEGRKFTLTVRSIGRDGAPIDPITMETIDVSGEKGFVGPGFRVDTGVVAVRVPAGTYSVSQIADWVDEDDKHNWGRLIDPEIEVTGDTEITLDLREADRPRYTTPEPGQPLNNTPYDGYQRTTAGGTRLASTHLAWSAWDVKWVTRTERVTKGRFRYIHQAVLGRAETAMTVLGEKRWDLLPTTGWHYTYVDADGRLVEEQGGHPGWTPFRGVRDLPVVDVGRALPADLAGRDLKGRLALVETGRTEGSNLPECFLWIDRVRALRDAGAAGIVGFAPAPGKPEQRCVLPLGYGQPPFTGPLREIGVPVVSVSTKEGLALRAQAAGGTLKVRVTGTPDTPYAYFIKEYEEGRVPASLRHSYRRSQFARVDVEHVTSDPALRFVDFRYSWKQDEEIPHGEPVEEGAAATGHSTRRDYVMVSRDRLQTNTSKPVGLGDRHLGEMTTSMNVYDRPTHTTERVWSGPLTPGGYVPPDKVTRIMDPDRPWPATPGLNLACDLCRRGDSLMPFFSTVRQSDGVMQHDYVNRLIGDYYEYRLTRDGVEIPLSNPYAAPAWRLPPERAIYQLRAKDDANEVTWTFASERPAADTSAPGMICPAIGSGACGPEPLVYVAYDLGDTLSKGGGAVRAGRPHTFTVNVHHAASTERMPRIAGLRLWASTDGGERWTPVRVERDRDGLFRATAVHELQGRPGGVVSLKAEAWDAAGNRIEQRTFRAFEVRAR
ncbi:S8 family peptidase [Bailinhaonella thermotolerans]|uniref:S8 family peptidase n=1 Tax=Bailinhaonella thermotolerans TaxID=1070861 RepID=UPI00192A1EDF|nr:S8 family serine peptidase [Bailinhaonella thermotolerans]